MRGALFRKHEQGKTFAVYDHFWIALTRRKEGEPAFMENGDRNYGVKIVQRFSSPKEAREAYEKREVDALNASNSLRRIEVWTGIEKLKQLV